MDRSGDDAMTQWLMDGVSVQILKRLADEVDESASGCLERLKAEGPEKEPEEPRNSIYEKLRSGKRTTSTG